MESLLNEQHGAGLLEVSWLHNSVAPLQEIMLGWKRMSIGVKKTSLDLGLADKQTQKLQIPDSDAENLRVRSFN